MNANSKYYYKNAYNGLCHVYLEFNFEEFKNNNSLIMIKK